MRKLHPEYPPMKRWELFKFGKYSGRSLCEVLSRGPAYVDWLLENLPGFTLAPEPIKHLWALRRFGQ